MIKNIKTEFTKLNLKELIEILNNCLEENLVIENIRINKISTICEPNDEQIFEIVVGCKKNEAI